MVLELSKSMQNDTFMLLALMTMDIVTGVIKGTKDHSLKSTVMTLGIRKKGAMLVGITFAMAMDIVLFQGKPTFSTMMVYLVLANEGLSIVENLAQLGVPIPKVITKRLEVMKADNESVEDIIPEVDKK